ncbi:MAG: PQQ-dependent sugar dehydrogenase [Chitinophagaceae bacterium]|nr:PQQ-dependent sugar dehydrogenase [Chitinophagaceae bacterium]
MLYKLIYLFALIAFGCKRQGEPQDNTGPVQIKDTVLVRGLQYPWEILWGPDGHIWMTERGGRISRVNPATGQVIPLLTISEVVSQGEGGLLGMALHPNFSATPHVFVAYNYNSGGYKEKIVRYTYNGATLTQPVTILDNITAASIHNGCRLVITPDLKLFITTGDAANPSLAQNINSLNGKVLRIHLDGSVPSDNPIPGNPVWSFGHRNAQGLVFANNILYSSEHGASTDDEINIIEKGRNYGWPQVEGFCDRPSEQTFCSANNVKEPMRIWTPTTAACGLDYYNHPLIPQWKNSLLMAALKDARLWQMKLDASGREISETNEYFRNKYGRMRDVCISPQGKVYICTSNGGNNDVIVEVRADR